MLLEPVQLERTGTTDGVDDRDGSGDEFAVAVLVEPVEGHRGDPAAVERGRHDDDELVGLFENAADGIVEDAGPGVDEDHVVVPVEGVDEVPVVLRAEGQADPRIVVGGDHLEPAHRVLGGECPDL